MAVIKTLAISLYTLCGSDEGKYNIAENNNISPPKHRTLKTKIEL